ncbi:MAG: Polymer-forming cytoskeletal [Methanobacterium sp. PtaU1.Bin242]|nr:MAG: Polymer-forming cytoskeletal [Methanobacterium sp. PtaU1.Bin242]
MKKATNDLIINGHGSVTGGKYNSVSINGSGRIDGDLECISLKINGQCTLNGNVKADSVKVNGNNSIEGNLEAEKVNVKGTTDIKGNLSADKAETYGSISIDGDCNAEFLKIEGSFRIGGFLNADELELSLYGPSLANEIGGSEITVKKSGKISFLGIKSKIMPDGKNKLTADVIEGDDVYLENTTANVVRGNNVTIGSGCKIELVEYKNDLKMHEGAEVGIDKKL